MKWNISEMVQDREIMLMLISVKQTVAHGLSASIEICITYTVPHIGKGRDMRDM